MPATRPRRPTSRPRGRSPLVGVRTTPSPRRPLRRNAPPPVRARRGSPAPTTAIAVELEAPTTSARAACVAGRGEQDPTGGHEPHRQRAAVHAARKPDRDRVSVDDADGPATIEVIDHGEGIPPQIREKIFQRFWRADSSRTRETGGSGLGLAIVSSIVARARAARCGSSRPRAAEPRSVSPCRSSSSRRPAELVHTLDSAPEPARASTSQLPTGRRARTAPARSTAGLAHEPAPGTTARPSVPVQLPLRHWTASRPTCACTFS